MTGLIILGIIVAVIGYAIFLYNDLVSKRQLKEEGWSGIDVQLKRRTDLIPNLLETVKGYMTHERETLEAVVKARAAATAGATAWWRPAGRATATTASWPARPAFPADRCRDRRS